MLCAVRAAAALSKPVIVAMAAGLRNRNLEEQPWKAADIAEFILQEVEQKRADIPCLCFNCAEPELCIKALKAIPEVMRQRLRNANISLGVYPNLNKNSTKRQRMGFSVD